MAASFDIDQGRREYNSLNEDWRTNINDAFNLVDQDQEGTLHAREWPLGLRALGFDIPKPETYAYLCAYGVPPSDWKKSDGECPPVKLRITREVFQAVAGHLIANRDPKEEAEQAWKLFDHRGTGRLRLEDIRAVANEINSDLPEETMMQMIQAIDLTGKGYVSKDEFLDMATRAIRRRQ